MMKDRDYPAPAVGFTARSNRKIGNTAATNPKDHVCHPCAFRMRHASLDDAKMHMVSGQPES